MLESSHLRHEFSEICRTLSTLASTIFSQFLIKCFSFIFFQFLNKCVFHFSKKTPIKLIPLSRFQITLFQNRAFSKNVDVTADVEIPAAHHFSCMFFFARVYFFNIVLGIFDNNLMWLPIESVYNRNLVSFSVFNPPGFKSKAFDVVYNIKIRKK